MATCTTAHWTRRCVFEVRTRRHSIKSGLIGSDSDNVYLKQLDIIRRVRETTTVTDEINLPQICVVGDQSAGKSSFLSRLTGVSFPTAAKMCTKAATVVTCNFDKSAVNPTYEIEECDHPGSYTEVQSTAEAITKAQDKMLAQASNQLGDNQIISDRSIKLRVTSDSVIDIIIVDLPGIQHAGETKEAIDALIESNIAKPETLNLIVSEAKQDIELTKALELAAKHDPTKERTIRVLSKFDNFDSPETRNRAVKLIKDSALEGQSMLGQLDLGPHAVISIGKDGLLRSDEKGDSDEQNQLIVEYGIPALRAGVLPLKGRLQPLFANLIRKCLPALKKNVANRLNEAQIRLGLVGCQPASPFEILLRCQTLLSDQKDVLEQTLTSACLLPLKKHIRDSQKHITLDFATSTFEVNSFQCILFQGQAQFNRCSFQIKQFWVPIVDAYTKKIRETMLGCTHCLHKDDSTKIFDKLLSQIGAECKFFSGYDDLRKAQPIPPDQEYFQSKVFPEFTAACQEALEQERFFGTTNHYFDSKFREDEICPESLEESFMTKFNQLWNEDSDNYRSGFKELDPQLVRECLKAAKTEVANNQVHTDLMTTQKGRVFSAVKAHFDVEKKTIVDILLKKTKDIVIQRHQDWIHCRFLRSETIIAKAKEDESVIELRNELLGRVKRLNNCMALMHDVPLPVEQEGSSLEVDSTS